MFEVGDKIRIVRMKDEPQYTNKEGVITSKGRDCDNELYLRGTWGGCSVYPYIDDVIKIK